jgi:hypothetical protein
MALGDLRRADGRRFRVEPVDRTAGVEMPDEFGPRRLARRTLQIVAVARGGRSRAAARLGARGGPRPVERGPAGVGGAGRGVRGHVACVVRVAVPAHLLPQHAVVHQLPRSRGTTSTAAIAISAPAAGTAVNQGDRSGPSTPTAITVPSTATAMKLTELLDRKEGNRAASDPLPAHAALTQDPGAPGRGHRRRWPARSSRRRAPTSDLPWRSSRRDWLEQTRPARALRRAGGNLAPPQTQHRAPGLDRRGGIAEARCPASSCGPRRCK